ncbi:MAG: S8 family serine peptidase [Actinomycetota bacterium]|nr:S8 family serine peptidase [Actinomycetota bacterium]
MKDYIWGQTQMILLIFIIIVLAARPYLLKNKFFDKYFNLTKYPLFRRISLGLIIFTMVFMALTIFANLHVGFFDGRFKIGFGDPLYSWHADYMDYEGIHKISTGKSQKIALIDSGISAFQVMEGNSIVLTGNDQDNNGHGTMMYSIIKGYKGDKDGVFGIAPDAEIVSIKVMDVDEKIQPTLIVEAIKKAMELKCTVINISIGSYNYNQEISDLIDLALYQDISVVASSGDYSSPDMLFPANKDGVISVGAITANGMVTDFTNAPTETIINAPGDEIKSVDNKKNIVANSGTSQSSAIIAGYVALLKDYASQKNTSLSNDEVMQILKYVNLNNRVDENVLYIDAFPKI